MEGDPDSHPGMSRIVGLLKVLDQNGGEEDLYQLGVDLHLELGEELQLVRAAESLGFVLTPGSAIILTQIGRDLIGADINGRKKLFRERILTLPLFQMVAKWLEGEKEGLPADEVRQRIAEAFPGEDPHMSFLLLVNWGRYSELFGYRADREEIYLDRGD
ncbi:MAG: AAA-associated domain-containing protein [Leptospirillum sp.]|jgi:NitT/TauT family transport system ATP-binding protein